MDKSTFKNLAARATAHARLADMEIVEANGPWPLPLFNIAQRSHYLALGFVVRVRDTQQDTFYTATIAVTSVQGAGNSRNFDFRMACPSTLLVSGAANRPAVNADIDRLGRELADAESLAQSTNELFGKYPDNASCSYLNLAPRGEICEHIAAALNYLQLQHPNLADFMEQRYDDMLLQPGQSSGSTDEIAPLKKYLFRVPVLVEGDRGGGKTYDGYEFARQLKIPTVLMAGHEGVEAADMLGYFVQAGAHGFVWMDGPVTEAFRLARDGKVLLFIDELLRIPQRQLSVLLTALTPDEHAGVYRLRTGRILDVVDGIAISEILECPIGNLAVYATTNVGAEFAVDDCDPALRERFHVIRRDTEEDRLRAIVEKKVAAKGFSAAVVAGLMEFFTAMATLKKQGLIKAAPTTRTITRAVTLANKASEVGQEVYEMRLQWVARAPSGQPVAEQLELIRRTVNTAFSISIPAPAGAAASAARP